MEQYNFTNPKTGQAEKVKRERWCWGVIYKDDTELKQFDDQGNFHRLAEIDQSNIKLFTMYKPEDISKRYDIVMPEGARIIHKYRNIRPYYMRNFVRIYMFGFRTGKKRFEYHYHFILPDDRLIVSDKDNISLETFELNR